MNKRENIPVITTRRGQISNKDKLFLQQIADDLLAVLPVGAVADVYPVASLRVVLPDELVERTVLLDPLKPPLAFLQVAVDAKVGRLALDVLGVMHAAHGMIEACATVAGAYLDRFLHRVAQRLEYMVNQRTHGTHLVHTRGVDDAEPLGGCAVAQFFEGKVFTNFRRHLHRLYEFQHLYRPSVSSPPAPARWHESRR